jgi:hypothetical protein
MPNKRKPNRGSFRPGPDRRRHRFTPQERSRGGRAAWRLAMFERPHLLAWLQRKIDRTARPGTLDAYRRRRGQGGDW